MEEDDRLIYLLTYELTRQCELSTEATRLWKQVYAGLPPFPSPESGWPADKWREENRRLGELALLFAHAFLTHAANASKLLWPSKPRDDHPYTRDQRQHRAETMRRGLDVSEGSPLRFRDLRDHFEHLDERLEVWYQTEAGQRLDLVDLNRLPFGLSSPDALVSKLRMFAPGQFRVLGDVYELAPIQEAVLTIGEASARWLTENRRIIEERRTDW